MKSLHNFFVISLAAIVIVFSSLTTDTMEELKEGAIELSFETPVCGDKSFFKEPLVVTLTAN